MPLVLNIKKKPIGSISDFTTFSFQAIKHFTTGDGGMLTIKNKKLEEKAKRIRWFGIDRKKKQKGIWKNDVYEVGYKYQMTDISATMCRPKSSEWRCYMSQRKSEGRQQQNHPAGIQTYSHQKL